MCPSFRMICPLFGRLLSVICVITASTVLDGESTVYQQRLALARYTEHHMA